MAIIKIRRGTTTPSGLTAGEPAFDTALDKLFVHDGATAVWVGAEILNDSTLSANSATKIPTQQAVKTYVDNNLAAGAVTSVGGVTGAVLLGAGTGITLSTSSKTITITNTGVHSFNGSTGAVSFANYVASAVAGNQITVSSATGNVTIGVNANPSFTTLTTTGTGSIGGNLTVTGNLTVNGTTTTVNSDVMTVDDPMIVIGLSGGLPLTVSDGGKDRGIAFTYFDGSAGRTGFFGWDASANEFVFQNRATISGDVSTGNSYANARIGSTLLLNSSVGTDSIVAGGGAQIFQLPADYGGTVVASAASPSTGGYILKSNANLGSPTQPTWIDPSAAGFTAFAATRLATARNIALTGNVTATGVAFDGTAGITLTTTIPSSTVTNAMLVNSGLTLGSTSISLGSTTTTISGLSSVSATTFIGGFSGNAATATTATNVVTTEQTSGIFYLVGAASASSSTGLLIDATATTPLSYNVLSGTITCVQIEAMIDGGNY
jgi:hypothetical protein